MNQRNFHLFQALLDQLATTTLSPADIAMAISQIVRHQGNAQAWLGRVEAIDHAARPIRLNRRDERIPYDNPVVTTGARRTSFGHHDWVPYAPVLKTAEDAIAIRCRVPAIESAEVAADESERRR